MTKASNQQSRTRQTSAPVTSRLVPAGSLRRRPVTPKPGPAKADVSPRFTRHGDGTLTLAQYQAEQRAFWAARD